MNMFKLLKIKKSSRSSNKSLNIFYFCGRTHMNWLDAIYVNDMNQEVIKFGKLWDHAFSTFAIFWKTNISYPPDMYAYVCVSRSEKF